MNLKLADKSKELAAAMFDINSNIRCQHFTFVYFKGRIVTIGKNSEKTHPINLMNFNRAKVEKERLNIKGTCSELDAFIKLRNTTNIPFDKVEIYNLRVNRNGAFDMAHCCNFCVSLIQYMNPKKFYYTDNKGEWIKYI